MSFLAPFIIGLIAGGVAMWQLARRPEAVKSGTHQF